MVSPFQKKLMPFMIIAFFLLVGCFMFFFLKEINEVQSMMVKGPVIDEPARPASPGDTTEFRYYYNLEKASMISRYYCANIFIRMRNPYSILCVSDRCHFVFLWSNIYPGKI